jgi:hypothetical protein
VLSPRVSSTVRDGRQLSALSIDPGNRRLSRLKLGPFCVATKERAPVSRLPKECGVPLAGRRARALSIAGHQNIGWSLALVSGNGWRTSQCSTILPSSSRKKSVATVPGSSVEVLINPWGSDDIALADHPLDLDA